MAPTEVLAQQHGDVLTPLCAELGIRLALLTGREKGKFRRETLADLEAGDIDILVGTHAIFQEGVAFSDLAFAVIDEQHRFGVHQRLALTAKAAGARANLLVMTATPIPRTLTMTAYGDMDVSQLDEKPPGRIPVDTRAMPLERLDEVVQAVRRAVGDGDRVYWVCPLVEESGRHRYRRGRGALCRARGEPGQRRRLVARPHEERREGRAYEQICWRRNIRARGDHRDRGRRRCSRSDRHGG